MDKIMYYIKLRSSACIIQLQTGQFHRNNIRENPINTLSEHFSLAKKFVFLLYGIRNRTIKVLYTITENVIRLYKTFISTVGLQFAIPSP